jgi:hypothetical protein
MFSALPLKADIQRTPFDVAFVPTTDHQPLKVGWRGCRQSLK